MPSFWNTESLSECCLFLWEPLIPFLGQPVLEPSLPFPFSSPKQEFSPVLQAALFSNFRFQLVGLDRFMSRHNNQENHNDMFYHSAYWKICKMLTELIVHPIYAIIKLSCDNV